MMKKKILFFFFIISLFSACNGDMTYSKYTDISIAGWERSDSVIFNIPPLKQTGTYAPTLGVRIDNSFPFKSVAVIVEQTVYPKKTIFRDTINCKLYDDKGRLLGNGVSNHLYIYNVEPRHYQQGDSIHIFIRHDMKREILPGITSVGIEFSKNK